MAYSKTDRYDVSTKQIAVKLKRDERIEYGRLVYTAYVEKFEQESGAPSTMIPYHPVDDRECRWTIAGKMNRAYFVQSILGHDDPLPASVVPIPLVIEGTSNGLASWFDHDPCSDYAGDISRGVDEMKRKLAAAFEHHMQSDIESFKHEMDGVSVEITPN